jgi:hypothetical protein
MTTVDDRKVNERYGLGQTLRSAVVIFTLRAAMLWDPATDLRFSRRLLFRNEIGQNNFVNSNCNFILFLQPKFTLFLHGFFTKIYVSSQGVYRYQEF